MITQQQKSTQKVVTQFCNKLFLNSPLFKQLESSPFGRYLTGQLPFYLFPESLETLSNKTGIDVKQLEQYGWARLDLINKPFILWYAKTGVQLCEVDIFGKEYRKPPKGLKRDTPYLYSLNYQHKDKLTYLAVVECPIIASILTGLNINAIATGSLVPTKGQIGAIAKLNIPLIYLNHKSAKSEQGAEIFVKQFAKYSNVGVCFIEDWDLALAHRQLEDEIILNSKDGIEFLATRIFKKHNGKDEYKRTLEIIETSAMIGEKNRKEFMELARVEGAAKLCHFAEALHLMGNLLQANLSIDEARELIIKRFGVSIFLRDVNNPKLN